jgi:heme exporter protein C
VRRHLNVLVESGLAVLMIAALFAVFVYVPSEREMGVVQRIFYFHVSSAIAAFVGFAMVFVASIQYLRTRRENWDCLALAAAELGVVFSLIVLISGPIWAKPIWGVFWRWEPRLTSMLIAFTIYVAYLIVRSYTTGSPDRTRRFAAVIGVVAFVNVPLVYYSVNLWSADQQLHPREVELAPAMVQTRYLAFAAIIALFFYLLKRRYELEKLARNVERLDADLPLH